MPLRYFRGYFPKDRKAKNVVFALLTPPSAARGPFGQRLVSRYFISTLIRERDTCRHKTWGKLHEQK
jgi:hypothetical protein